MLQNFFKLNAGAKPVCSQEEFLNFLQHADHVKNLLYQPDRLAPERPFNRIKNKIFENVSFAKTLIQGVEFRNCRFKDCLFIGSTFRSCQFHRCVFEDCNPHKVVMENTYINPNVFSSMLDTVEHANIGVHLFQQLYADASRTHQRDFAHSAEYYFRKWKRYELDYERRTKQISFLEYARHWTPNFAYWLFAGYGVRTRFFAFWTAIMLIGIVLVNHACWDSLGVVGKEGQPAPQTLANVTYFSIITVSTLGYGDFVPTTDYGMLLIAAEALVGIVWIGLFASTVIKRVAR